MKLSAEALDKVRQAVNDKDYAKAYGIAHDDLVANNPGASGGDADVIHWVDVARQVNSGAITPDAIAIRASNKAAVELLEGKSIGLFGPEQTLSTNAVGENFFSDVLGKGGIVPDLQHIGLIDARSGLNELGLPMEAWAGAVPSSIQQAMGLFSTNDYYNSLTPEQQQTANVIHTIAADLAGEYLTMRSLWSSDFLDADLTVTAKNDVWLSRVEGSLSAVIGAIDFGSKIYNGDWSFWKGGDAVSSPAPGTDEVSSQAGGSDVTDGSDQVVDGPLGNVPVPEPRPDNLSGGPFGNVPIPEPRPADLGTGPLGNVPLPEPRPSSLADDLELTADFTPGSVTVSDQNYSITRDYALEFSLGLLNNPLNTVQSKAELIYNQIILADSISRNPQVFDKNPTAQQDSFGSQWGVIAGGKLGGRTQAMEESLKRDNTTLVGPVVRASGAADDDASSMGGYNKDGNWVDGLGRVSSYGPMAARKEYEKLGKWDEVEDARSRGNSSSNENGSGTRESTDHLHSSDHLGVPIALDLDGDGIESGTIRFDADNDGQLETTGWVGGDDGWLVVDWNGDGKIDQQAELDFARYGLDGMTDMDGLAYRFDTNRDGVVDASDRGFDKLLVWQDANMNGVTDEGELRSLADRGIASIDVHLPEITGSMSPDPGDISVLRETSFTRTDGTTGIVGDVVTGYNGKDLGAVDGWKAIGEQIYGDSGGQWQGNWLTGWHWVENQTADTLEGGGGHDLLAGYAGDDTLIGNAGYDLLAGGSGNDTLIGGTEDDLLMGGSGNDRYVYSRGDGGDVIIEGAGSDDRIVLGEGISVDDLIFKAEGDHLIIGIRDPSAPNVPFNALTDSLSIADFFTEDGGVERIEFSNGQILDLSAHHEALKNADGTDTVFTTGLVQSVNAVDARAAVAEATGANAADLARAVIDAAAAALPDAPALTAMPENLRPVGAAPEVDANDNASRQAAAAAARAALSESAQGPVAQSAPAAPFTLASAGVQTDGGNATAGTSRPAGSADDAVDTPLSASPASTMPDPVIGNAGTEPAGAGRQQAQPAASAAESLAIQEKATEPAENAGAARGLAGSTAEALSSAQGAFAMGEAGIAGALRTPETAEASAPADASAAPLTLVTAVSGASAAGTSAAGAVRDDAERRPASKPAANTNQPENAGQAALSAELLTLAAIGISAATASGAAAATRDQQAEPQNDAVDMATMPGDEAAVPAADTMPLTLRELAPDIVADAGNSGDGQIETSDAIREQRPTGIPEAGWTDDGLAPQAVPETYGNLPLPHPPVSASPSGGGDNASEAGTEAGTDNSRPSSYENAASEQLDQALSDIGDHYAAVRGTDGDDVIEVNRYSWLQYLDGKAGTDTLIVTDDQRLTLTLDDVNFEIIHAGSSNDVLSLRTTAGALYGRGGDDMLTGGTGDDIIDGGSGDDWLAGGGGGDRIAGGTGWDTVHYDEATGSVQIDLDAGTGSGAEAEGDTLSDIEAVIGSDFDDQLRGDSGRNTLSGGGGDDLLSGDGSADLLIGGDGEDTADYTASSAGVAVDLAAGTGRGGDAEGDRLETIEDLIGSRFADTLTGTDSANRIIGLEGNDLLEGLGGNDFLEGDAGDDVLLGGDGNDRLSGGAGTDWLEGGSGEDILEGGEGADTLIGGTGADVLDGGDGYDLADYSAATGAVSIDLAAGTGSGAEAEGDVLSHVEDVAGSASGDHLSGDAGGNILTGNAGDDVLDGRAGNDTLLGGDGDDLLIGGAGADVLDGGDGRNRADYSASTAGVAVSLAEGIGAGGDAEGDRLANIRDLAGSAFDDVLIGDGLDNHLAGNAGNDTLAGGAGDDLLGGGSGSDTLLGETGDDTLSGGDGDDSLSGGAGADRLSGGAGFDTADYSTATGAVRIDLAAGTGSGAEAEGDRLDSIERVLGSAFADVLLGSAGDDTLIGNGGNDTLIGGTGADTLSGGSGDDVLEGGAGADVLDGGDGYDLADYSAATGAVSIDLAAGTGSGAEAEGDVLSHVEDVAGSASGDHLSGDAGGNILTGNAGDDVLDGRAGNDTLLGGDGDDLLIGGAGADVLDGGDGRNRADYSASTAGVAVSLAEGIGAGGDAEGDRLANIRDLAGSAFDDVLIGDGLDNHLAGNAGNDTLAGGAGDDLLGGGSGSDTLLGETGDDTLSGGDGDDSLSGGAGADRLSGGAGFDTADYSTATGAVRIDLAAGTGSGAEAEGDRLDSIERVLGSAFADVLLGSAGDDTLIGNGGNDTLIGGTGADTLSGGSGDDVLEGGAGADMLDGGDGYDLADYSAATGAVSIDLAAGTGSGAEAEGDVLSHVEDVAGSASGDHLSGDAGGNILTGNAGDDVLDGRAGNDTLLGGDGDDLLIGGAGADVLDGGDGRNRADYSASTAGVAVSLAEGIGAGGDAEGDRLANIRDLAGSAFDDVLIGDGLDNHLAGNAGNDTLAGGAGDDLLGGGSGSDTLLGETGDDTLSGGDGDDSLSGGAGADRLSGGAGFDTADYSTATGAVRIDLAAGTGSGAEAEGDRLDSIERVLGSAFADVLLGSAGDDTLIGNGGNDTLIGGTGADTLSGGSGDDVLEGGAGADVLDGGDGYDLADYSAATGAVSIDLAAGTGSGAEAEGDVLSHVEDVAGSASGDHLSGDAGGNILTGNAGDDVLDGRAGNDTLLGGDGDDLLIGGAGADVLDGGDGRNRADYSASTAGVAVSLAEGIGAGGDAEGDRLANIRDLAGSAFDDVLIGDGLDNHLAGNAGNDTLAGGAGDDLLGGGSGSDTLLGETGDDTLSGGDGDDSLSGGAGADRLSGGAGFDTADYSTATGAVRIDLAAGTGSGAEAEGDRLDSIERVLGSAFADVLLGSAGDDTLIGNGGNDTLIGGTGADTLSGGSGDDVLEGGAGADVLDGGSGWDIASYAQSGSGISVNLLTGSGAGGDAAGDQLISIEQITGSAFADTLTAGTTAAELRGGGGNDVLAGGTSSGDLLFGEDGDDVIRSGSGADTIDGGAGRDRVSYAASMAGILLDLTTGLGSGGAAAGDRLSNIEEVEGSQYADTLKANGNSQSLYGGAGNDTLWSLSAVDLLMDGGDGDDTLVAGGTRDRLAGGNGYDTADYSRYAAAVGINLSTGLGSLAAAGHTLQSIEAVIGGSGGDTLTGDTAANQLSGGAGADHLYGGGGNDLLYGGSGDDWLQGDGGDDQLYGQDGDDTLVGGAGADLLDGGTGSDTASYQGAGAAVTASLRIGRGTAGDANGDTYASIEYLHGSSYADTLEGSSTANTLWGDDGADTLLGGAGNDVLDGGNGDDSLWGEAGDDTLAGGAGRDIAFFAGNVGGYQLLHTGAGTGWVQDIRTDLNGDDGRDTLSGIEEAHFANATVYFDRNNVTITGADQVTTDEDQPILISASSLLANDIDFDGDVLSIGWVGGAVGGTVSLHNGDVLFTPDANYNGVGYFSYKAFDGIALSAEQKDTVTITAVPDYPKLLSAYASIDNLYIGPSTDHGDNGVDRAPAHWDYIAHFSYDSGTGSNNLYVRISEGSSWSLKNNPDDSSLLISHHSTGNYQGDVPPAPKTFDIYLKNEDGSEGKAHRYADGHIENWEIGVSGPVVIGGSHAQDIFLHDVSITRFDFNGDGLADQSSWFAPDAGILGFDKNGDQRITELSEFELSQYGTKGMTDMQALAYAFDSNHDNIFDARDEQWAKFVLWTDQNSDGISDEGEVKTLDEAGISAIDLHRQVETSVYDANYVFAHSDVIMADGSHTQAADAGLSYLASHEASTDGASALAQADALFTDAQSAQPETSAAPADWHQPVIDSLESLHHAA